MIYYNYINIYIYISSNFIKVKTIKVKTKLNLRPS